MIHIRTAKEPIGYTVRVKVDGGWLLISTNSTRKAAQEAAHTLWTKHA